MAKQPKREVDLVIDPGAFSAWRRGEVLSVKRYGNFLLKHLDKISAYFNLDVIPGRPGQERTNTSTEEAAEAGWKNLIALKKMGLNPAPVYHMGERRYWLEKMIGEGFDYIGLGGFAKVNNGARKEWLDETFGFLCGNKGYPKVKLHGFGMTSVPLMFRYPWHTVDSMSWVLMGGYGWILVPWRGENGKYDWGKRWHQIGFSSGTKKSGGMHADVLRSGNHISLVSAEVKKYVTDWLEMEGFDCKKLLTSHEERIRVNCRFFRRTMENYKASPFLWQRHGFFCAAPTSVQGALKPPAPFKLLFTINITAQQSNLLQDETVRDRLLSYYWFKDSDPFSIPDYVSSGTLTKVKAPSRSKKRSK